jgi:hypothetical protein
MQATKEVTQGAIPEAMIITTKRIVLVETTQMRRVALLEAEVGAMQMVPLVTRMVALLEVGAMKMILTTMGGATQVAELVVLSTIRLETMIMRTNLLASKVGLMMRGSRTGVALQAVEVETMRMIQRITTRVALLAVEAGAMRSIILSTTMTASIAPEAETMPTVSRKSTTMEASLATKVGAMQTMRISTRVASLAVEVEAMEMIIHTTTRAA